MGSIVKGYEIVENEKASFVRHMCYPIRRESVLVFQVVRLLSAISPCLVK
jgi:hypothetical protein